MQLSSSSGPSLQTGDLQLRPSPWPAWAATGPLSMGTLPSTASRQACVSSRNHSREGGTGWMPSTPVHSGPLGHPLACTSQAHPCLHTHRGLSHQLPRDSQTHTHVHHSVHTTCGTHSSHTHTLCHSHSELTHPEVPPQGYPHSCSGIIVGVPRRLTRLGA